MVIVKESSFSDLFEETIALLNFEDQYVVLTFKKQFSVGRSKHYRKGESLIYEIFSQHDLIDFKSKMNVKKLPCELVYNEQFLKIFYYMGGV